jgi:uncharacterized protein
MKIIAVLFFTIVCYCFLNCTGNEINSADKEKGRASIKKDTSVSHTANPAVYFEIPVTDMNRAMKFYKAVFAVDFTMENIDNNEMALFPFTESGTGITGALAKGEIYKPSKTGTLIYLHTDDIEKTLSAVLQNGGKTLYPKTAIGNTGFVAELEDSEGNRIALLQQKK